MSFINIFPVCQEAKNMFSSFRKSKSEWAHHTKALRPGFYIFRGQGNSWNILSYLEPLVSCLQNGLLPIQILFWSQKSAKIL